MRSFVNWVAAAATLLGGAANAATTSDDQVEPWRRPAMMSNLAVSSSLLAGAMAGHRLVAVGERGHILYSDDNGGAWHQAAVPVSVTLTAVRFLTPEEGWAVGHSGVVLHTVDGGQTWTRQLDGAEAARLALDNAGTDPAKMSVAKGLAEDGPDKPFLDIAVEPDGTVMAVGAYGLAFRSSDKGGHWVPWMDRLDNPRGLHINGAALVDGQTYLVGEQGLIRRSPVGAQSFETVDGPYPGSLFGVIAWSSERVLVVGLRGNAFMTRDGGKHWEKCQMEGEGLLLGGTLLADGTVLVASQDGRLMASHSGCAAFRRAGTYPGGLAAVLPTGDGGVVLLGTAGAIKTTIAESGKK